MSIAIPPDHDVRFECLPKYARLIVGVESRCEEGVELTIHDLRSDRVEGDGPTRITMTLEVRKVPKAPAAPATLRSIAGRVRKLIGYLKPAW